jgi:polyhydroxyalkanoate synthesis regulator phasin
VKRKNDITEVHSNLFTNFGKLTITSMNVSEIELYQILKGKLGEDQAKALVTFVEQKVNESFESKKETLATKQDIYELSEKLFELSEKLSEKMNSHFKWLIGLFVGQMAFMLGIVYFILNFSK